MFFKVYITILPSVVHTHLSCEMHNANAILFHEAHLGLPLTNLTMCFELLGFHKCTPLTNLHVQQSCFVSSFGGSFSLEVKCPKPMGFFFCNPVKRVEIPQRAHTNRKIITTIREKAQTNGKRACTNSQKAYTRVKIWHTYNSNPSQPDNNCATYRQISGCCQNLCLLLVDLSYTSPSHRTCSQFSPGKSQRGHGQ